MSEVLSWASNWSVHHDVDTFPWILSCTSNFTSKIKFIIFLSWCFPSESLNTPFTHPPKAENLDPFLTLPLISLLCSLISFFTCSWLYLVRLLNLSLCLPLWHQWLRLVLPRLPQRLLTSFSAGNAATPPLSVPPRRCISTSSVVPHSPQAKALTRLAHYPGPLWATSEPQHYPLDFTMPALINTEQSSAPLSHKFLA